VFVLEFVLVNHFGEFMFSLFTTDIEITQLHASVFPIVLASAIFDFWQAIFGGVVRALGKQGVASVINFIAYYLIVLPLSFILTF